MLFGMSDETPRSDGPPHRHLELAAGIAVIIVGLVILAAVPQLRHCVSLTLHGDFGGLRAYNRSLGVGGLLLLVGLMLGHAIVFYPSEIVTATAAYVYGFGPGLALVVGGWLVSALLCYALGRSVGRPLLGSLPLTVAVAYLGSRAETLSTSNPLVWVAVAVLIGLLSSEWLLRRRRRGRGNDDHTGQPSESDQESKGQPEQAVHPAIQSTIAERRRDGSPVRSSDPPPRRSDCRLGT